MMPHRLLEVNCLTLFGNLSYCIGLCERKCWPSDLIARKISERDLNVKFMCCQSLNMSAHLHSCTLTLFTIFDSRKLSW